MSTKKQTFGEKAGPVHGFSARLLDRILGWDFFISHAWVDAQPYAHALASRLDHHKPRYKCFLDVDELVPRMPLDAGIERGLRNSTVLILVGSPKAALREKVREEVKIFDALGRPIIAIDVGKSLEPAQTSELALLVRSRLHLDEAATALTEGPSDQLIGQLVKAFQATRRRTRQLRFLAAAATAFAVLFIIAMGLYFWAQYQWGLAVRRLADIYEEQGRQELLQGKAQRALVVLNAALQEPGGDRASLPFLVGQAARQLPVAVTSLVGHTDRFVNCAGFSPDGQQILTYSDFGRSAIMWNGATGTKVYTLGSSTDEITFASLSADGRRVLTRNLENTAKVWDAETGRLLSTIAGNPKGTAYAQISPDGKRVLTSDFAETAARLWDAKTGAALGDLNGHEKTVSVSAFSPDGRRVVTGSYDHTARVWEVASRTFVCKLEGHTDSLTAVVYSANGQRIVTGSRDQTVRVWDAETGKLLRTRRVVQTDGAFRVRVSPNGQLVVTWLVSSKTPELWDAETGQSLAMLEGHKEWVNDAAFSPDSRRIVTGGKDYSARVWDVETGRCLAFIEGLSDEVRNVSLSSDGNSVVTACGKTPVVWDLSLIKAPTRFSGHTQQVTSLDFAPDGRRLVTCSPDKTARVWDVSTGKCLGVLVHPEEVIGAAYCGAGRRIVTISSKPASGNNTARVWDADAFGAVGSAIPGVSGYAGSFATAICPDGRRVIAVAQGVAKIWDLEAGKDLLTLDKPPGHREASFSPDGNCLLTIDEDDIARVWDVQCGNLLASLRGHPPGTQMAGLFSRNRKRIATLGSDATTRVWRTSDGKQLATLDGLFSPSFARDGSRLVTFAEGRNAKVWAADTGQLASVLQGHAEKVISAFFDSDGKRIVTASADKTAMIWEAGTGRLLARLEGHKDKLTWACFDRAGTLVATAGKDKAALVWPVAEGSYSAAQLKELVSQHIPFRLEQGRVVPTSAEVESISLFP